MSKSATDEDDARAEEEYAGIFELTGYIEFWFGTRPKSIELREGRLTVFHNDPQGPSASSPTRTAAAPTR